MKHETSRWWLLLPLALAIIACSLTADDGSSDPVPTNIPVGVLQTLTPTVTVVSSTATPTTAPQPTAIPCNPRSDWQTYTVQTGDTLTSLATRTGTTSTALAQGNCITNVDLLTVGQTLRVPVQPVSLCDNDWFFEFNSNVAESDCPDVVDATNARGQDFEGGRVLWYQGTNAYPNNRIYVVYNDGAWQEFTDTYQEGVDPFRDEGLTPPDGRFQPVGSIGKIWREQSNVRNRLGWAFEDEVAFAGRRQQPQGNVADLYIDRGTDELVFRLRTSSGGSELTWIVAGGY